MKQRYALQLENTPHPTLSVINTSAVFMTLFFGCLHTRLGCIVLINRGRKKHDKSAIWGVSPWVVVKDPPIITVTSVDHVFSIKLSKMVKAFGLEVNTPYKGIKYEVTVSYWNNKTADFILYYRGCQKQKLM